VRGRLVGVEPPELPDGYFLVTAAQIPGENALAQAAVPVLARERVSYIGEPVALLLGPDESRLEELAGLCEVRVEDEPDRGDHVLLHRDYSRGAPPPALPGSVEIEGFYETGIQEHWYPEPQGALAWFLDNRLIVSTATQWPGHVKPFGGIGAETRPRLRPCRAVRPGRPPGRQVLVPLAAGLPGRAGRAGQPETGQAAPQQGG